jgi:hypothetical protein
MESVKVWPGERIWNGKVVERCQVGGRGQVEMATGDSGQSTLLTKALNT